MSEKENPSKRQICSSSYSLTFSNLTFSRQQEEMLHLTSEKQIFTSSAMVDTCAGYDILKRCILDLSKVKKKVRGPLFHTSALTYASWLFCFLTSYFFGVAAYYYHITHDVIDNVAQFVFALVFYALMRTKAIITLAKIHRYILGAYIDIDY